MAWLLVAAIAIVCVVAYQGVFFLRSYGAAQLAQAPDEEVEYYLRRQLQLSSSPASTLADALNSERTAEATAAAKILRQKRDGWRNEPALQFRQEVVQLVIALQSRWDDLRPAAQHAAAELAADLTTWNLGLNIEQTGQFNRAIDSILRQAAAPESGSQPRRLISALALVETSPPDAVAAWDEHRTKVGAAPGGYLPVVPLNPQSTFASNLQTPSNFPSAAAHTSKPLVSQDADRSFVGTPDAISLAPGPLPESARPSPPIDLRNASDVDVMHWLHDSRPEVIEHAEQELLSRRFQPYELTLARRLTSPSVEIRLQFAKELQRETTFDRMLWLTELAHDVDPDIRIIAQKQLLQLRLGRRDASDNASR